MNSISGGHAKLLIKILMRVVLIINLAGAKNIPNLLKCTEMPQALVFYRVSRASSRAYLLNSFASSVLSNCRSSCFRLAT